MKKILFTLIIGAMFSAVGFAIAKVPDPSIEVKDISYIQQELKDTQSKVQTNFIVMQILAERQAKQTKIITVLSIFVVLEAVLSLAFIYKKNI